MVPGGKPLAMLDAILERYPVAMHGVPLSIGSTDGLDAPYLADLKALANHVQPIGGASFAQVCADLGEQFFDQEAASVAAESLRIWLLDEMIAELTGLSD